MGSPKKKLPSPFIIYEDDGAADNYSVSECLFASTFTCHSKLMLSHSKRSNVAPVLYL